MASAAFSRERVPVDMERSIGAVRHSEVEFTAADLADVSILALLFNIFKRVLTGQRHDRLLRIRSGLSFVQ